MKKINVIFYLILISCSDSAENARKIKIVPDTNRSQNVKVPTPPSICDTNFDSTLVRLAKSFRPVHIDLGHSISNELNQFMLQVDTNCLRKQKMYPFFINTILAKLSLYQLKCCNQHYELRATNKEGAAGAALIVNEFEWMAGFQNKPIDMLSSEEVEDYIHKTPELNSNSYLSKIIIQIKKEESRR